MRSGEAAAPPAEERAAVVLNHCGQMIARFPDEASVPDEVEDEFGDVMRVYPEHIRTVPVSQIPPDVAAWHICPSCGAAARVDDMHVCPTTVPADLPELPQEEARRNLEAVATVLETAHGPNTITRSIRTVLSAPSDGPQEVQQLHARLAQAEDALRKAHAALRVHVPGSEDGYSGRVRAKARAAIEATGVYPALPSAPAPGASHV